MLIVAVVGRGWWLPWRVDSVDSVAMMPPAVGLGHQLPKPGQRQVDRAGQPAAGEFAGTSDVDHLQVGHGGDALGGLSCGEPALGPGQLGLRDQGVEVGDCAVTASTPTRANRSRASVTSPGFRGG